MFARKYLSETGVVRSVMLDKELDEVATLARLDSLLGSWPLWLDFLGIIG